MHSTRPSAARLSFCTAHGCQRNGERGYTASEDREDSFVTVVAPLLSLEDFGREEVAVVAVGQKSSAITPSAKRKWRKGVVHNCVRSSF